MAGRPTNEPSNYFAFSLDDGSTFQFLRHLDGTALEVNEQTESIREGGDGQEIGISYKTAVDADGQAVLNSRPEVGHRLAVAALGADEVAAPAAAGSAASGIANEHTAVPTSTQPDLVLEQFWADVVERVEGARVTGFTVEWEAGRPLKLTPEFMGGGTVSRRNSASALTPTREAGGPFFYPGATVVLDGAGNSKVTKGRLVVRRNLDGDIRTVGLSREDVVPLNFDTELALTLKYEDAGLYDKAHYGGASAGGVPIALATGAFKLSAVIGAGTAVRYQEFGLNAFNYTAARVNKLDPDGKTMYLDVTGAGYRSATHQVYVKTLIASAAAIA